MNRKLLAIVGLSIPIAGFGLLRAQSPKPSPAPAPAAEAVTLEWSDAEPVDSFDLPMAMTTAPDFAMAEEPDQMFFIAGGPGLGVEAGPATAFFTEAMPAPDPQGPPPGAGVQFIGPDPQDNITFVGFEAGLGNKPVVGAPYSATITSDFVQTLADGNKIERKNTTTVYRDGQGRTRREQTLPAIGQYSASATAPQVIFINDPVSGVSYVLNPADKTARKMTRPEIKQFPGGPGPGRGGRGPDGPANGGNPPRPNARRQQNQNVTTDSLGSQNIEGILVQGTRVTRTVPAGTFGNQNPIKITSERWYSPDLKLNLLVKNDNPMSGSSTVTLSNISRDEPAASLFQIPSDYTVQEQNRNMKFGVRRGGPPQPPPPPQQ